MVRSVPQGSLPLISHNVNCPTARATYTDARKRCTYSVASGASDADAHVRIKSSSSSISARISSNFSRSREPLNT